jgi:hypothetical protein
LTNHSKQITLLTTPQQIISNIGDKMELTELNKLYTYLERCRAGARIFTDVMSKLTKEEQLENQEFIANALAQSWQVEKVDMLAETNNQ